VCGEWVVTMLVFDSTLFDFNLDPVVD
jgi:hypothetical protein